MFSSSIFPLVSTDHKSNTTSTIYLDGHPKPANTNSNVELTACAERVSASKPAMLADTRLLFPLRLLPL